MILIVDALTQNPNSTLTVSLRHLKCLHFDLADVAPSVLWGLSMGLLIGSGGLARLLKPLSDLRDLDLRILTACPTEYGTDTIIFPLKTLLEDNVWPQLCRLSLSSLWLEAEELADVLSRHGGTIAELTLNLGGTTEGNDSIANDNAISLAFRERRSHLRRSDGVSVSPEWLQVAEVCASLPKLQGLLIEHPSASVDWTVQSLSDTRELMQPGIAGRPNVLNESCYADVWEFLEATIA